MSARAGIKLVSERLFDWALGIETHRLEGMTSPEASFGHDSVEYQSAHHMTLIRCLTLLDLRKEDTFYDIGCGAGRMVCLAARRRLAGVVGIEIDKSLAKLAARNAELLRGRRSPIRIARGDASTAHYGDGTAIFMNNPFGPETMRCVLSAIARSLEMNPRPLRILYLHPVHGDLLDKCGWLECCGEVSARFSGARGACWKATATTHHSLYRSKPFRSSIHLPRFS
jgi:predicted RNA methylase